MRILNYAVKKPTLSQGLFIFFALIASGAALAAPSNSLPTVMEQLQSTAKAANSDITKIAIKTLGAALVLQWIITHWKEVFTGDISSMMLKGAGAITWAGVAMWAMDNQSILSDMFSGYLQMATQISGVDFNPSAIWANGVNLQNNLIAGFNKGTDSSSLIGAISNFIPALMLMVACIFILIAYAVVAFSVLISMAEFWLMFAVTPIAIGMMGLTAFRDQGMAPLKGVISLGLRIIILGLIVKILGSVQESATVSFSNLPDNDPMETVWFTLGGVFACSMMAINAGKIASSIASGSANFSGSDAIKGGMQMASTGAAIASTAATGIGAAASVANHAGGAAGALGKGVAEGLGQSIGNAFGGGGGGGLPGGASLGVGKGSPAVGGAFPPNPSAANEAKASGGNASSAGIGGASGGGSNGGGGGGGNNNANNNQSSQKEQSSFGKTMDSMNQAGEALSQDNNSVGISMNTRGE